MGDRSTFKSLDKSKRKQKVIDTAIDLFHKKGYRATTLDDVSKILSISKAALYHYVSSKENLLSIIYIQAIENFFRDTYEISELDISPDEKLRLIIRSHVKNIITKNLPMFAVFFSEENQLHESDLQEIRKEKKRYNQIIEEIIKDGISKGLIRAADPKLHSYAIIGMCNWIYKWYMPEYSSYSPEEVANHFIDLLEKGYLEDEKRDAHAQLTREGTHKKSNSEIKTEMYQNARRQLEDLMDLIDELEKTVP
jgi:AcrR family transcriptional regulator